MSFDFKSIFNVDYDIWLRQAISSNADETVYEILRQGSVSKETLKAITWDSAFLGYGGITDLLIEYGGCVQDKLNGQLYREADEGNIEGVSDLIKAGADLFHYDHAVLYNPVLNDDFKMVNFLLSLGVNARKTFSTEEFALFVNGEHPDYDMSDEMIDLVGEAIRNMPKDAGNVYRENFAPTRRLAVV